MRLSDGYGQCIGMDALALAGIVVGICIGVPQIYLARKQLHLAREQFRLVEDERRARDAQKTEQEGQRETAPPPPGPVPTPAEPQSGPVSQDPPPPRPAVTAAAEPGNAAPYAALGAQVITTFTLVRCVFDLEGYMNSWPTTPREEWSSTLWGTIGLQLIVSVVAGVSAFKWFEIRQRAFWDRGRELLYLLIAVIGPLLSLAVVIVRRDVLF